MPTHHRFIVDFCSYWKIAYRSQEDQFTQNLSRLNELPGDNEHIFQLHDGNTAAHIA